MVFFVLLFAVQELAMYPSFISTWRPRLLLRGAKGYSAAAQPQKVALHGPEFDAGEDASRAAALVYRHVPGESGRPERVALRAGGEGFVVDGEPGSRPHAELGGLIVGTPDSWSAGAVLRPMVQDAVLPTCVYVGGWGELGYQAQSGPARDAIDLPRTPFLPRVSAVRCDPEGGAS